MLQSRSELLILSIRDQLLSDHKRAKTITGEIFAELLTRGTLSGLDLGCHNDISTFHIEHDFLSIAMLDNDTHSFRLRAERETLENVIFFSLTVGIQKFDVKLFSFLELHVQLLGEFDKCNLIRTSSLELFLGAIISIGVHRRHIVAQA